MFEFHPNFMRVLVDNKEDTLPTILSFFLVIALGLIVHYIFIRRWIKWHDTTFAIGFDGEDDQPYYPHDKSFISVTMVIATITAVIVEVVS